MDSNQRFWTEFIEMYRDLSCLWNVACDDYSNKQKRNAGYEVLLQKLRESNPNATLDIVKKKINNMRTAFRREMNKAIDSKRTGGRIYEPTLWYYKLMLFTAQSEVDIKDISIDERDEDYDSNTVDTIDESNNFKFSEVSGSPLISATYSQYEAKDTSCTSRPSSRATQYQKRHVNKIINNHDQKKQKLLDSAHDALTSNDEDEYFIAGKRIGYQLKAADEHQRTIAEKLISDVMFYAKTGKLTEDTRIHIPVNHQQS